MIRFLCGAAPSLYPWAARLPWRMSCAPAPPRWILRRRPATPCGATAPATMRRASACSIRSTPGPWCSSPASERIALVSLDLGRAPTRQSTAAIRQRVKAAAGIEHLFLVGSHTHHGPVIELDNWPKGQPPYVRELEDKLAQGHHRRRQGAPTGALGVAVQGGRPSTATAIRSGPTSSSIASCSCCASRTRRASRSPTPSTSPPIRRCIPPRCSSSPPTIPAPWRSWSKQETGAPLPVPARGGGRPVGQSAAWRQRARAVRPGPGQRGPGPGQDDPLQAAGQAGASGARRRLPLQRTAST